MKHVKDYIFEKLVINDKVNITSDIIESLTRVLKDNMAFVENKNAICKRIKKELTDSHVIVAEEAYKDYFERHKVNTKLVKFKDNLTNIYNEFEDPAKFDFQDTWKDESNENEVHMMIIGHYIAINADLSQNLKGDWLTLIICSKKYLI